MASNYAALSAFAIRMSCDPAKLGPLADVVGKGASLAVRLLEADSELHGKPLAVPLSKEPNQNVVGQRQDVRLVAPFIVVAIRDSG